MSFDRFEKAADFLDRAVVAQTPEIGGKGNDDKYTKEPAEALLSEFDEEMANTRKILERIPEDKFAWKPHEKSFTLGKLVNQWRFPVGMAFVITGQASPPCEAASKAELLDAFDKRTTTARAALAGTSDDHLAQTIHVTPAIKKPRAAALQWFLNHMIHHRGQLSVYLRMLGVPVPGMYGAVRDEKS